MRKLVIFLLFIVTLQTQTKYPVISDYIKNGDFQKATRRIDSLILADNLSEREIYELSFEKEKMARIRKDFSKSDAEVLEYVRRYIPEADGAYLEKWEHDGSLEYMVIDGKKKYFNRAHTNLFLINEAAGQRRNQVAGYKEDELDMFLGGYIPEVLNEIRKTNSSLVKPVAITFKYTLTVDADAVPPGEIIRCWLPYPREGHERQRNLKFGGTNSSEFVIADNSNRQRTIYMERQTSENESAEFTYTMEYTAYNQKFSIDTSDVLPYDKSDELYIEYTSERLPHIAFTKTIRELSAEIVGDENHPYLTAMKIFTWISEHIPWAGAREYSTIDNISGYCADRGYGDCGIQTLLFMTLCRYNGIPSKWQSGWMLHPGEVNLHDWCEIYFEGIGWIPVDQSFGLMKSEDEEVKYFYFGGIDAYHLIINDDYSNPLFPAKIHPRSETVDFQRGEVEWRGGNLYFDKWDYNMTVDYE